MSAPGRPGVGILVTLGLCLLALGCVEPQAPTADPATPVPRERPNVLRNPDLDDVSAWEFRADAADASVTPGYDQAGFLTLTVGQATSPQSAGWAQQVAVAPGASYRVSYRVHTEGLAGWAGARLSFSDGEGRPLWQAGGAAASGDTPWTTCAWRLRAPPGAVRATLSLGVEAATAGRAAFDDCYLRPDDAPLARALIVDYRDVEGRLRPLQQVDWAGQEATGSLLELDDNGVRVLVDVATVFPNPWADPNVPGSYDFRTADATLSALAEAGAELFVCLADGAGREAGAGTPLRAGQWGLVARHIAMHYNDGWSNGYRYGIDRWEVQASRNAMAADERGTSDLAARLEATMGAMKAYDPTLRVGGPALDGAGDLPYLDELLERLAEHGVRPDFVTWQSSHDGAPISAAVAEGQVERLLERYGMSDVEVIASSWRPVPTEPGLYRDAGYEAAHLVGTQVYWQDTHLSRAYSSWSEEAQGHAPTGSAPRTAMHLLGQFRRTPQRLATQGGDSLGFVLLAGKSDDARRVQIVVADTGSRSEEYRLALAGFPPGFRYVVREVSRHCRADVVAEGSDGQLGQGVLICPWRSPAMHVIELWWGGGE